MNCLGKFLAHLICSYDIEHQQMYFQSYEDCISGRVINTAVIEVDPEEISVIMNLAPTRNLQEIR